MCEEERDLCVPADPGTVCRPAVGTCDVAEVCVGDPSECPGDIAAAAGLACDDGDACTAPDNCDGDGNCVGDLSWTVPPMPRPLTPENGALTGSVHACLTGASCRPLFRWGLSSDGCREPDYELEVDDSCSTPGFGSCDFSSPEIDTRISAWRSWRPLHPLRAVSDVPVGRRYYWRVRSCRGDACSVWSSVRYVDVGRVGADFNGDRYSDLAVGAPIARGVGAGEGRVFVYEGGAGGPPSSPSQSVDNPEPPGSGRYAFGRALATADYNADGFADLAVGFGNGVRVVVLNGGPTGLDWGLSTDIWEPGLNPSVSFGAVSAAVGDLDADGFADLAVGAATDTWDYYAEGALYVYLGGPAGPRPEFTALLRSPTAAAYANLSIALGAAGDVDGDGYSDLLAGARLPNPDGGIGHVFVYLGDRWGVSTADPIVLRHGLDEVEMSGVEFGRAVGTVGDADGDGFADVVVGVRSRGMGWTFLFAGVDGGLGRTPSAIVAGTDERAVLGYAVASCGDANADGFSDVLVGLPEWQEASPSIPGRAVVFPGRPEGLDWADALVVDQEAPQLGDGFGETLACAGDLDGDGYSDIVIGAPRYRGSFLDEGRAQVVLGSSSGLGSGRSTVLVNPSGSTAGFGTAFAGTPPVAPTVEP